MCSHIRRLLCASSRIIPKTLKSPPQRCEAYHPSYCRSTWWSLCRPTRTNDVFLHLNRPCSAEVRPGGSISASDVDVDSDNPIRAYQAHERKADRTRGLGRHDTRRVEVEAEHSATAVASTAGTIHALEAGAGRSFIRILDGRGEGGSFYARLSISWADLHRTISNIHARSLYHPRNGQHYKSKPCRQGRGRVLLTRNCTRRGSSRPSRCTSRRWAQEGTTCW